MAIGLANGDGKPPDWQDFVGIVCLLVINSTISFIEENNARNAAAALMAGLAPKTKVIQLHQITNDAFEFDAKNMFCLTRPSVCFFSYYKESLISMLKNKTKCG